MFYEFESCQFVQKSVDRFGQLCSDRFMAEFSVIVDEAISHLEFIVGRTEQDHGVSICEHRENIQKMICDTCLCLLENLFHLIH